MTTKNFKQYSIPSSPNDKIIKLVCISDTHERHWELFEDGIPNGDILIHTGDITKKGSVQAIQSFNEFLGKLPHKNKIVICGNHERELANLSKEQMQALLSNCTYLMDDCVTVEGIKFFGAPWTYASKNVYFYATSAVLKEKWAKIPEDVDVVMTHCPAYNVLDLAWEPSQSSNDVCATCNQRHQQYEHWGDLVLREQLLKRVKPTLHVCGHVHDDYGTTTITADGGKVVHVVNAATDWNPKLRKPWLVEFPASLIKPKTTQTAPTNATTATTASSAAPAVKPLYTIRGVQQGRALACSKTTQEVHMSSSEAPKWEFDADGYIYFGSKQNGMVLSVVNDKLKVVAKAAGNKAQQWKVHKDSQHPDRVYIVSQATGNALDIDHYDKKGESVLLWALKGYANQQFRLE